MALLNPLIAIFAVVVGAVVSYIFSRLAERARFDRDLMIRWDQRRLDAYISYISAVKRAGTRANQIHDLRNQGISGDEIDLAIADLRLYEVDRAAAFEVLPLLADGPTIKAAHELSHALFRLEEPAKRGTILSHDQWHEHADGWVVALNDFHVAARASLRLAGPFTRWDRAGVAVFRPERSLEAPSPAESQSA